MARGKKYQPEQVVNLLRQIEVAVANGKTTDQACRDAGIVEQTYYRWRKEYEGLQVDQAKRLNELEQENTKLKCLVRGADYILIEPVIRLCRGLRMGSPSVACGRSTIFKATGWSMMIRHARIDPKRILIKP
jgi:hypothetical protein